MKICSALLLSALCLAAGPNLRRVNGVDLPKIAIDDAGNGDYEAGSRAGFKSALEKQLARCKSQNANELWDFAGEEVARKRFCDQTIQWFLNKLVTAKSLNEIYQSALTELEWYQSMGAKDTHQVEFTGYFYPVYSARKTADAVFKYPVYASPKDLVQVSVNGHKEWRRKVGTHYVTYYTRAEIVNGALNGQGLELGYLDNPIDAYMLEIQGSGALIFKDVNGTETRSVLNYSNQNGLGYTSLGKLMRAAGVDESYISLQGIRKYFTLVHPELWEKFSNQNESHVFFKKAQDGPYGAGGTLLTPKHSVAIDTSEFPLGAVSLVEASRPIEIMGDQTTRWKPFTQFMLTQDTGGAIKGPGRVDLYWGEGHYAEVAAGQTDHPGNLFFCLVPEQKR